MKQRMMLLAFLLIATQLGGQQSQRPADRLLVTTYEKALVSTPPESLGLDPFYKKYAEAFGIPIVSSEKVDDAAVVMARDIVNYMLMKRPDVRDVMIQRKSRVLIMAKKPNSRWICPNGAIGKSL